jgi:flagellum-specific peptidoglycan hydrolase FlgJ
MKMNFRLLASLLLVAFMISSCGSKKKVVTTKKDRSSRVDSRTKPVNKPTTAPVTKTVETTSGTATTTGDRNLDYINSFKNAAMKEMKLYRIPASIKLAQGIQESGSGISRLAVEANNHFGIKCHTAWTGARIYHDDDSAGECFRKYNDPTYSYRDHSLFLTGRARYASLFELNIEDYEGWAKGLRKAGYATDLRYPEKLIAIIEKYELYRYDEMASDGMVEKKAAVPASTEVNHVVQAGDTLYGLSKKYNVTVDELKRLNKLRTNALDLGQVLRVK